MPEREPPAKLIPPPEGWGTRPLYDTWRRWLGLLKRRGADESTIRVYETRLLTLHQVAHHYAADLVGAVTPELVAIYFRVLLEHRDEDDDPPIPQMIREGLDALGAFASYGLERGFWTVDPMRGVPPEARAQAALPLAEARKRLDGLAPPARVPRPAVDQPAERVDLLPILARLAPECVRLLSEVPAALKAYVTRTPSSGGARYEIIVSDPSGKVVGRVEWFQ